MGYPGDQMTALPERARRSLPGEQTLVPARVPAQAASGDEQTDGSGTRTQDLRRFAASGGGYGRHASRGHSGPSGPGPAASSDPGRTEVAGQVPPPRRGDTRPGAPRQSSPGSYPGQPGADGQVPPGRPGSTGRHRASAAERGNHVSRGNDAPRGTDAKVPAPGEQSRNGTRSRRGPAHGYPPKPGEPGPWYPQSQFSAWNTGAPQSSRDADFPMASAPTWADVGPGDPGTGSSRGGVALAERPDDAAPGGRRIDERAADRGDDPETAGLSPRSLPRRADDPETAGLSRRSLSRRADDPETAGLSPRSLPRRADDPETTGLPRRDPRRTDRHGTTGRTRAGAAPAGKAPRKKGRVRRRIIIGASGVIVLALGVTAYMSVFSGTSSQNLSQTSSATLSLSNPTPSMGTWGHIDTRAADSLPLALDQLFPAQFSVGGASYIRTAQLGGTNCVHAVFGAALQAAVRKYGCSQVMRASYLSSARKLMGTIGVLNLSSVTGAIRVGRATGSSEFISQLTAATGPTHNLTKGTGLEEAEVKGHYLILIWAEFTTLRAPNTAAQKTRLKTFSANLISQTANISLTSRMVTGKPQAP